MDLSADRDAAAAVAADAQQLGELLADDPRQLIARIRPLASSAASAGQTTLQLLRHVHAGTLPPLILSSWLPLAVKADVGVLRLVIGDEVSQGARRIGLKLLDTLSRRKTKKRSPEVWAALGGPQGLKHLVETLPLQDVRRLLRIVALNRGFRYRLPADDADALVTHFLPALSRQGGQAARDAEGSQRQQTDSLLYLLHLASDELVTHAFGQCSTAATLSQLRLPSLAVSHATLLQRVVTRQLPINEDALRLFLQPHNENSLLRLVDCKEAYTPVSGGLPPETSDAGTVHPAVPFAIDLFRNSGGLLPIYLAYKIAARVVAVASAAKTPFRFIVPLLDEIVKFCAPDDPRRAAGMTDFLPYVVLTAWGASLSTLAPEPSKMFRQPPIGHPTRPTPDDAELLTPLVERLLTGMGRRVERTSDPVRLLISCPFRMGSPLACLPKDTRLPFTVTFCRLFHGIDLETASTDSARYFTITTETLAYYPPGDGQWLLRQLAALAKDEECIEPPRSSTFASLPSGHDKKNHLRAMLQAMLEGGPYLPVSTLPPTSVTVATYKASAEHGAEPNDRLQWACAALELAVKRQDLSLLAEVTQWSERFLNDVHIGSSLLSKMWSHDYCLALSCVCFRNPERYDSSLDDLRQSIKIANDILNFQIDMVLRIRQSPEKRYGRHRSLGSDLICRTVRLRAGRVRHLHRTTRTSYAELGTLLLQSLIPVTIKYESIGLQDEFADLEWDVAEGALRGLNADNCPPDAMLPFLDNLARQRDEIWAKARLHKTPSLGSLPECWPRGLPVQTLVPNSRQWLAQAFKQPILAPYIHQRATGVLRTPRSFAILPLPSDTSAIGAFVNDVPAVIEAYLCSVNTHDTANEVLQLIGFYEGELGATSHYLQVLKDDICRRRIAYRISHWQLRRLQVQLGLERPYESRVPRFPISTISLGAKGDAAAGGVGDDEALPDATPTELTTFDCCLCPPE
ncbi:hypothetical protein KEM52_004069 [Ascosphaera acerosa]|nr:hypothetical protein KEM52_004069 [Ascosphaera acerosa]